MRAGSGALPTAVGAALARAAVRGACVRRARPCLTTPGRFRVGVALIVTVVGLTALWAVATQPFVKARPWSGAGASAANLERHVRQLAEVLPPRSDDGALDASARYIHDAFARYGEARFQPFEVRGITYSNVVLRLDRGAGRTVIVGAHYDAFGGLPGADDNASGVAGLLELARLLGEAAPALDVELVAYALEEPPWFGTEAMGSRHHAAASDAELTIVLEMIGYYDDAPGSQHYPLPGLASMYSEVGDFIAIVGRFQEMGAVRALKSAFLGASKVPVHSLTFAPIVPGVGLSDHRSYWIEGMRAVMITDTAYERNPNYHTASDTPDTLDYRRMAEVVTGVYASLFALAERAGGAGR